jgi:hypothetical protein
VQFEDDFELDQIDIEFKEVENNHGDLEIE